MPTAAREQGNVDRIAQELEKLARGLRSYPAGEPGARTVLPSTRIVASLRKINATLAAGARARKLGPARFGAIGREFGKIGTTLRSLGSARRTTRKRTTRRTTRKKRAR